MKPLGIYRTQTKQSTETHNVAEAYMALSDGKPWHLPKPSIQDGVIMEGAGGVQSSVIDMLNYSQKFMEALNDQLTRNVTSTAGSPFKQLPMISRRHIDLSPGSSDLERSYAMGWLCIELPGPLGTVGLNPMHVDAMPLVGKGLPDHTLVYHHQGSLIDFSSSLHLIPSLQTAIVVLTNSIGNNDGADWLGQLLVETVLDNPDKNDYVQLAKSSVQVSNHLWKQMAEDLQKSRVHDTPMRILSEYAGNYYNAVGNWHMEVWVEQDGLYMCHQDDRKQSYRLEHYNFDTFTWLLTRNESVKRGRFPMTEKDFYVLAFGQSKSKQIDHVIWKHDPSVPEGKTFRRRTESASEGSIDPTTDQRQQNRLGAKGRDCKLDFDKNRCSSSAN